MADIFSGFQTKVVDNPSLQIEVVRKPLLSKGNSLTIYIIDPSAPLFSANFHNLFESRIKQHPEKLRIKRAHINEDEVDLLML
jgi:hypothetical protein